MPADRPEDGWNLHVLVLCSYLITPYNWWALFRSDMVSSISITTRCWLGLVITVAVGLCSIIAGAALKRYAKQTVSLPEIAISFVVAGILFCGQTVFVAELLTTPLQLPFLTTTRIAMILAQTTIAGWFLKVFWDRAVEMISEQFDKQTGDKWDDPVV